MSQYQDIEELEKEIKQSKRISETDISKFTDKVYVLEKKYMNDTSNSWKKIQHLKSYLHHEYNHF